MSGWEARTSGNEPRLPDRAELVRLVREVVPDAEAIWLYGSFADGTARADSDVDLALLAHPPLSSEALFERTLALAARLGRPVHLVDLRCAPALLRFEVLTSGVRLFASDPIAADRFETTAIGMYQQYYREQRERFADIRKPGRVY